MIKRLLCRLAALLTVLSFSDRLHAKVASIEFADLVRGSDVIVSGTVIDVITVKGVKIARVNVLETYKGNKVDEILFLAQPTWACDISEAVKGETALLFLRNTREGLNFFSRLRLRKELKGAGLGASLFSIMDSGRGRMPMRIINEQQFVTFWDGDVLLPSSVSTAPGPDPEYSFIRSARLSDIIELVRRTIAPAVR